MRESTRKKKRELHSHFFNAVGEQNTDKDVVNTEHENEFKLLLVTLWPSKVLIGAY